MSHPSSYTPRLLEARLQGLMAELPAVLLVGPRAAGKTTLAQRYAATTVRLDRDAEATAFRADPDVALSGLAEPILLDEWQVVPSVLGAVKRAVDTDPRPGRFLITGSVHADLQAQTWPGTGRVVRLTLWGLTLRERFGRNDEAGFFDRLSQAGPQDLLRPVTQPANLGEILELALQSGFPEPALRMGPMAREAWLESYLDQLLTRDVPLVDTGRDPERLRRYLVAHSATTAQVVDDKTLWDAASIHRKTAVNYERLLRNLFVLDALPAWSGSPLKQLVRSPKRYVADAALAAAALQFDASALLRRGDLLGPFIETFVVSQLRAEAAASRTRPRLFHLRTGAGRHEVDVVAEVGHERVVGIEIKATAAPTKNDAKHLQWLQRKLGSRFYAGVVFHTGPRPFWLANGIVAVPIAALWS